MRISPGAVLWAGVGLGRGVHRQGQGSAVVLSDSEGHLLVGGGAPPGLCRARTNVSTEAVIFAEEPWEDCPLGWGVVSVGHQPLWPFTDGLPLFGRGWYI